MTEKHNLDLDRFVVIICSANSAPSLAKLFFSWFPTQNHYKAINQDQSNHFS